MESADVVDHAGKATLMPYIVSALAGLVIFLNVFIRRRRFERNAASSSFKDTITGSMALLSNKDSVLSREGVKDSIEGYEKLFHGARKDVGSISTGDSIKEREREYKTMVNSFYDLVTDFYEWGWGQSFHFAPRYVGETFLESLVRAEYFLALKLGLSSKSKVLDVGCGVGGPMRNIARFTGADITGVTINDYQVKVGNQYCVQKGLGEQCRLMQGDFQDIGDTFPAETFDAAYEIEATCHSPNRREVFRGIHKCLKPGGIFVGYEWVVCPNYDGKNPDHVRIKEGIEVGNGLPTLVSGDEIKSCLRDAGFEVLEAFDANKDVHSSQQVPWYATLQGSWSLEGFRMTHIGRCSTHLLISFLELIKIAPPGSVRVSALLNATALDLVEGGEKELFTPSYFFMARKP